MPNGFLKGRFPFLCRAKLSDKDVDDVIEASENYFI